MILLNDYMNTAMDDKRIYVDSDIRIGDECYKIYGNKYNGKQYYVVYNKSIIGTFRPQYEYHPTLSDLYKFLNIEFKCKHTLRLGDIVCLDGDYYIITTPTPGMIFFANIHTGRRWSEAIKVSDVMAITYDEIYKYISPYELRFNYIGNAVDYVSVKS